MKKSLLFGLAGLVLLIAVPPFLKSYGIYLFSTWLVYVIANMGLNLTVSYAGQKSLGHAAFFGINNIGRPELLGLSLESPLAYYYFVLGIAVVLSALMWKLLNSPWGKAFTALRDNPIRAESLGIHIQTYTLLSFAIGAVYAGIAGALFASLVQFIEPAPFAVGTSFMMYLMVVVGGPGYFFGPLLGTAVGVLLPEWLRFAQAWYLFVFGAAVVLLMLWLPDGLLSIPDRIKARRQARDASAARAANAAKLGVQA